MTHYELRRYADLIRKAESAESAVAYLQEVIEAERGACAKIADEKAAYYEDDYGSRDAPCQWIAELIRNRGNKESQA